MDCETTTDMNGSRWETGREKFDGGDEKRRKKEESPTIGVKSKGRRREQARRKREKYGCLYMKRNCKNVTALDKRSVGGCKGFGAPLKTPGNP